ncbi:MAG: C25 family cysteine peptidase [Treponema sp.]|jgi:hypothetical protein|nr:C25 family cysteine peptidase [Treponema sp.]
MNNRKWNNLSHADSGEESADKIVTQAENELSVRYRLNGFYSQSSALDDYIYLDMPKAGHVAEKGSPMLIQEGLFVAIPSGAEYSSFSVNVITEQEIGGEYNILPVPENVLEGQELVFEPNQAIYSSDDFYPDTPVKYIGTIEVGGTKCVHLSVCPFRYQPPAKKLIALTAVDITIKFDSSGSHDNLSGSLDSVFASQILGISSCPQTKDGQPKKRMIIVTTDDLIDPLRILEGVKTFLYDVTSVTIEGLRKTYPGLSDVLAIRTYLMAEHAKSPLSYVLLGGNTDKIPTEMITTATGTTANDNYYCSGDDRAKPLPLFALGRLPVSTVALMNSAVDFAACYNRFFNNLRKEAVFTSYNDVSRGYEQCKRDIKSTLAGDFVIVERYDGSATKTQLINSINSGTGFVNYRGHGANDCWQSGNGLGVSDIPGLSVGRNTPNVFSIACNNNAIYASNCFGTAWIANNKAITFLSASAPSYTVTNHCFDKFLWEAIHTQKLTVIGDIFVWATIELYRNYPDRYTVCNILEYLLLGDPSVDYMDDKRDTN